MRFGPKLSVNTSPEKNIKPLPDRNGKVFSGTHFITAHLSPDVDTMIASFWGWMDAFGAASGPARIYGTFPGGPPDSPVHLSFYEIYSVRAYFLILPGKLLR